MREPGRLATPGPDPDADRLDRRDRHQRLGEPAVEACDPTATWLPSPAGQARVTIHLEGAAERVAGLLGVVDRRDHPLLDRGVRAVERRVGRDCADPIARRGRRARPRRTRRRFPRRGCAPRRRRPRASGVRWRPRPRARPSRAGLLEHVAHVVPSSYLSAPARLAWPGRGRVTGVRLAPAASAGVSGSTCIVRCQFGQSLLAMRSAMGAPVVLPRRMPEITLRAIRLDCHAAPAPVAALPPPELGRRWRSARLARPRACPRGSRRAPARATRPR